MEHAFIEGEDSHRQIKKFKQRLKYRLDKGYGYDEAYRLAGIKEIASHPGLRLISSGSNSKASVLSDATAEIPLIKEKQEGRRNSSSPHSNSNSYTPSQDEIRLEVAKLKAFGLMTEIPTRTNFVSSAETLSSSSVGQISSDSIQPRIITPSISKSSRLPYWTVSTLACCWLVYSMTSSLSGHWFWNLLVAIAFEFTPMLMLAARVDPKQQKTVTYGAVGIFLVGLGLYLAPSLQMVVNESAAYFESSAQYDANMTDYRSKASNSAALIATAKADAERSAQSYEEALTSYGEKSWRSGAAKKQKLSDAAEWKRLSKDADIPKAPLTPKISDDLTKALQAIATRIGLFAVVFLSMFVMQRLERPETA